MKHGALASLLLVTALAANAQAPAPPDLSAPARGKGYVSFAAEPQTVVAGRRSVVELRFQVADGFHVNSHKPSSELLIATEIRLEPPAGVRAGEPEFPPGTEFSFSFQPGEKVSVYSGGFTVRVPVVAAPGTHILGGTLRYQACDRAACFPPRSLPVQAPFTAR